MVTDLVGVHCEEVVACAFVRADWPHKDPNELCMEATLLVVEDPSAAEEKEGEARPCGLLRVAAGLGSIWRGGRERHSSH